jgi:NAD(P)-dependent dehydrogenase (short-subunit alcohol dehydrogenase family)
MLRKQFDTNVLGLAAVTRGVLPHMRRAGGGVIVNISSIGGRLTFPLGSAHHATKWAVEGLTESLQYELSPHNVRVKLVEPGGIRNDFVGRGMVRSEHPAYAEWVDGLDRYFERANPGLPGPGKVARTIYRAATDGSRRLRYPVHHQPLMLLRALLPDAGWRAVMERMVRGLMRRREAPPRGVAAGGVGQ